APQDWAGIEFFRLLNHSSGITMVVTKDAFGELASDPASTNETVYRLIRDEPLDYQPGEYSRYRQSGYAIGEMILKDRLGKSFAALVSEGITTPAGMTETAHPTALDKAKAPVLQSAGGYETTASDMAKLFKGINSGAVIDPQVWKSTIMNEDYLFADYSLGSVIEFNDDVMTMGHSGGGARANIRYAPDLGIGAMVCTDDQSNSGLAMPLARMLIEEVVTGTAPPLPMLVAAPNYADMSAKDVIDAIGQAEEQGDRYKVAEIETFMNEVGYTFLAQERVDEAIVALFYNADRFPQSPNAQDSLGEALLEGGQYDAARARYQRVLELDPGNDNATRMLGRVDELEAGKLEPAS
ncbi:MAG: serine hydrolase, partial [Erythrobacter sp.]|nr:serine hydrolase [Erythrobacter sp.]